MKIIRSLEYQSMPWKNGLGSTAQIDIYPENANFPQDFLWRLSSATVESASPFSNFPGYDRLLTVWKGMGLLLNAEELRPQEVLDFPGERVIECELIKDTVIDLGLIYSRSQVAATMEWMQLTPHETQKLECAQGTSYIFCGQGSFNVIADGQHLLLKAGDTLMVNEPVQLQFSSSYPSCYLLIHVQQK